MSSPPPAAPPRHDRFLSVLFFLSGMTGLSYEVIWFKQFSHVWGSSTLAMASVVGAFLLCLGIGSRIGGILADRVARPVRCYALCEIGIGLFAILIPWETDWLWRFSIRFYAALRDFPASYALVRCLMTLLVIGPPCVLMGATLPMLVRQRAGEGGVGRAAGWLYGINTIGAALGCYLIGFHLLPEVGLSASNLATAIANVVIGAAALLVGRNIRQSSSSLAPQVSPPSTTGTNPTPENAPQPRSAPVDPLPLWTACLVAMLTGFSALALQTVWNRQLALVLGSSTYAFTAVLFVVLTGIGCGSLLFHRLLAPLVARPMIGGTLAVGVMSLTAVSAIGGVWILPFVADLAGHAVTLRSSYAMNALVCIGGSALVELVPSIAMGALLPLLVALTHSSTAAAGTVVGRIYAWNTVGALAGAIATSILLVPTCGTETAVVVAVLVYMAAALLVAFPTDARPVSLIFVSGVAAVLALFWLNPQDPRRTNLGMYLYGFQQTEEVNSDLLFFQEGATSNVLVTQIGDAIALRVNGKVDGSSHGDMSMQLGLAYLPRFLNPEARNVLVIGFGTGATSGASLLFPETRVTCCEIEPAVYTAAQRFAHVNHRPHGAPNFTIVYDDARAFVQGTDERFDLILSEPSNPWIAGVANLFTREFYELASRKLAPGGILAQWIQTYAFTPDDYALIVRTLQDVFPHSRLIRISDGDTILLAATESLDRDPRVLHAAQRLVDGTPDVQADLKRFFATSDVLSLILSRVILDEQSLQTLSNSQGTGERNLDRDCRLEFRAARHLFELRNETIGAFLVNLARCDWFTRQWERLGCGLPQIDGLHDVIETFTAVGNEKDAVTLLEFGLHIAPDSPELLVDQLILQKPFDFDDFERLLERPDPNLGETAGRIGAHFASKKEYETSVKVLERLCERYPKSALLWNLLANSYAASGKLDQAGQAQYRAATLDPFRYGKTP